MLTAYQSRVDDAGAVIYWLNCWLCKYENLSLDPRTFAKLAILLHLLSQFSLLEMGHKDRRISRSPNQLPWPTQEKQGDHVSNRMEGEDHSQGWPLASTYVL